MIGWNFGDGSLAKSDGSLADPIKKYTKAVYYMYGYTHYTFLIPAMENEDEKQPSGSSFFENRSYANKRDIIQAVIEYNR